MPSSYIDSVPPIVHALVELDQPTPLEIIDVGAGWGKYGLLAREYLGHAIDGLDVHPDPVLDFVRERIYRRFYHLNALTAPPAFWRPYDLVLMVDVIEHMGMEEGAALLGRLILFHCCRVLVATPKVFFEQGPVGGNPYERHLSFWGWQEFRPFGIKKDYSTIDATIYLL